MWGIQLLLIKRLAAFSNNSDFASNRAADDRWWGISFNNEEGFNHNTTSATPASFSTGDITVRMTESYYDEENGVIKLSRSFVYNRIASYRVRSIYFGHGHVGASMNYHPILQETVDFTLNQTDEFELSVIIRIDDAVYVHNTKQWLHMFLGSTGRFRPDNSSLCPGWMDIDGVRRTEIMPVLTALRNNVAMVADRPTFLLGHSSEACDLDSVHSVLDEARDMEYGATSARVMDFDTTNSWRIIRFQGLARNLSNSTKTFREIAMFRSFSIGSNVHVHGISHRQVLEEPLTLEANEQGLFTVDFRIRIIHKPAFPVSLEFDNPEMIESSTPGGLFFAGQTVRLSFVPRDGTTHRTISFTPDIPFEYVSTNQIRFVMPEERVVIRVQNY
jgi:hypothetical protein